MHLCKPVVLLAATFPCGIFLGEFISQQGLNPFLTPSASAKSTATTSSSNNLNNINLAY